MIVKLTNYDLMRAAIAAERRRAQANTRQAVNHGPSFSMAREIVGTKGELAFAKLTGLRFLGDGGRDRPDFPGYEIKTSDGARGPGRYLFVKANKIDQGIHRPSTVYVHAWTIFDHSDVEFRGWITLGEIAEHPETELREINGSAYAFPTRHLHPMEVLPCLNA